MLDPFSLLSVIGSLIIIEVLLSVDNALINASIANNLPQNLRARAVRLGVIFGAGFRLLALLAAGLIIQHTWIRVLGGVYLIYVAIRHLGEEEHHGSRVAKKAGNSYGKVIFRIALADLAFGIDNVITAIGISENMTYVIIGVMLGIAAMVVLSPLMLKVIRRFPSLAISAYVIVGIIGALILVEAYTNIHIEEYMKFSLVALIALTSLAYERITLVRTILKPLVRIVHVICRQPFRWVKSLQN